MEVISGTAMTAMPLAHAAGDLFFFGGWVPIIGIIVFWGLYWGRGGVLLCYLGRNYPASRAKVLRARSCCANPRQKGLKLSAKRARNPIFHLRAFGILPLPSAATARTELTNAF